MTHEELVGAVARGWCSPENSHKQMDSDLAMAIVAEVRAALTAQPVAPQPPIDNAFVAPDCEQFSSHKSDATRLLEILGVALDECRRLAAVPPAPAVVPLTDEKIDHTLATTLDEFARTTRGMSHALDVNADITANSRLRRMFARDVLAAAGDKP